MKTILLFSFIKAQEERAARGGQNEARAVPLRQEDGTEGNLLRDGAEGLMSAMRELLHTMTFR